MIFEYKQAIWKNKRPWLLVKGVGINDSDYPTSRSEKVGGKKRVVWQCPIYAKWGGMLERACYQKHKDKHPAYKDVGVCEKWLKFSNFKAWVDTQVFYPDLNLDKDLLIPGNKIYTPEACCFVDTSINMLLHRSSPIGEYPLGVSKTHNRNSFTASVMGRSGYNYHCICSKATPEEAHAVWQEGKIRVIVERINSYRDKPEYRKDVEDALWLRVDQLQSDLDNGRITEKLL